MNSILTVYRVTVEDDEMVVFDNLEKALDFIRDTAAMGVGSLGDTICLELKQIEMTWAQYHRISLEDL